ncbi:hypothetical protein BKA63DRAFT_451022, partial [Paraphoma chrysanthemicola]
MLSAAWEALLADSARTFNGGPCSFPLATTVPVYEPPNTEYERVFFDAKSSYTSTPPQRCSAGWIIPGSDSLCNPIFVAHSLLSAIWLVRETLPPNTLSNDAWACLAHAADKLASLGESIPPPSAQKAQTECQPADSIVEPAKAGTLPPKYTRHTNNTMTAERRRIRKQEAMQAKKRYELGLLAPNNKAPRKEHAAYTLITQLDETLVAWIIKQLYTGDTDFFTSTKTPYLTACSLLEKAREMGN